MSKHLFIGGNADGEWRNVEDAPPMFSIAKPVHASTLYSTAGVFDRVECATTLYRRERFCANEMEIVFYVEQRLPIEEAAKMLFGGYRKS
jgi:hypothetical protein